MEAASAAEHGPRKLLRSEVTEQEIAEVISRWTGIPVSKMLESEREKLLHIEDALHERVVGRTRRCAPWRTPSAAHAPGSRPTSGRSARSCS